MTVSGAESREWLLFRGRTLWYGPAMGDASLVLLPFFSSAGAACARASRAVVSLASPRCLLLHLTHSLPACLRESLHAVLCCAVLCRAVPCCVEEAYTACIAAVVAHVALVLQQQLR